MKSALMELIDKDVDEKKPERPHLRLIYNQLKLNTGMIFTNGDLADIKKILDSQVREAPAKIGILAPADVTIPAGPTGMDPKQTSFFQNLNIATKIVKGQVEIVNAVKIITTDEKITPGQAALLDKLKIRPFEYKMHIKIVLDNGRLYPAAVLSITTDTILAAFGRSAENVAAVSLATGYST
jgi:large subunit ribosomal protein LP0